MEDIPNNVEQLHIKLEPIAIAEGIRTYKDIQDPSMKQFAKHVQEQKNFHEICKHATSPKSEDCLANDPQYQFYKVCDKMSVPAINIFNKLDNQALHLVGYNLNETVCSAFVESCKITPKCINQIVLDNNGLYDKGLSLVLEALNNLDGIKKVVCKNQMEFQQKSLKQLKTLVRRAAPKHLEELRLTNLRMTSEQTRKVLKYMLSKKQEIVDENLDYVEVRKVKIESHLRKLSLVKANLDNHCLPLVIQLLRESKHLVDLDISYNELTQGPM